MPRVLNRTNLSSIPLHNPHTHPIVLIEPHFTFTEFIFLSFEKKKISRAVSEEEAGRQTHMSANMALNFKSNLFRRQELSKIDVHISSINGFHNSPAWRMGASQSLSSKL